MHYNAYIYIYELKNNSLMQIQINVFLIKSLLIQSPLIEKRDLIMYTDAYWTFPCLSVEFLLVYFFFSQIFFLTDFSRLRMIFSFTT